MTRKMKSKKKQFFRKEETDPLKSKRRRKPPKEKYRHARAWMEEDFSEDSSEDSFSSPEEYKLQNNG